MKREGKVKCENTVEHSCAIVSTQYSSSVKYFHLLWCSAFALVPAFAFEVGDLFPVSLSMASSRQRIDADLEFGNSGIRIDLLSRAALLRGCVITRVYSPL